MQRPAANAGNRKPWSAASNSSNLELGINLGSATTSMSAVEFLDTNILVYAYDRSEPRKQQIAQGLVRRAVAVGIAASSQVLCEFAATLLPQLAPRPKPADLIPLPIPLVPPKPSHP